MRSVFLKIPTHWPWPLKVLAIFVQPVYLRLLKLRAQHLFHDYQVSRIAATLWPLCIYPITLFLKLDSINKSQLKQNFYTFFPQVKPSRLSAFDLVRITIQAVFLAVWRFRRNQSLLAILRHQLRSIWVSLKLWDRSFNHKIKNNWNRIFQITPSTSIGNLWNLKGVRWLSYLLMIAALFLFVTVPFSIPAQAAFMAVILLVAYPMRKVQGQLATIIMITLSVISSSRYIWWRFTETIYWQDWLASILGSALLLAESYAWLVLILGYFQSINPLKRRPEPLPENTCDWPSVDVYIPTYNEPLSVVKPTTLAALNLEWPADKINVYILDDGCRESFKEFAEAVGAGYIIRDKHTHAKAGNMNNAMKYTHGDYIAIFDCDHIPARSFLQLTMGQFLKDKKVCMVQTPHHFFSADPFEKNLKNHSKIPNENMLFYGLIQDGNDMWNATFFCGSCAVLKRSALEDIGGFAFDTVTEDAHTALRMQRRGYKTAYINIPQAAGLATDSLSAHVGQRIRWARGMAQIFRIDNPLLGQGLNWRQRACYLNAMMHFLSGIPRLIFLTAPLALIFFNSFIIHAEFLAIMLYVIPTLLQIKITNSRIQGKYRYSFWGEVYESVLAWYILKPTTIALINPNKGKFNVTEKGGLNEQDFYDWNISAPCLVLFFINAFGFIYACIRLIFGSPEYVAVLLISMAWTFYNLIVLGAAIAVAAEAKQVRVSHRVQSNIPAHLKLNSGHLLPCVVTDYSDKGMGIRLNQPPYININMQDSATILLTHGTQETGFPVKMITARGNHLGLLLQPMSTEQQMKYILATFSRVDAWLDWQKNFQQDKPSFSFRQVRKASWVGVQNILLHAPKPLQPIVEQMTKAALFIYSFLPRRPTSYENT
ncbi:UDP-forming cellulose synthase catalytic subunit [Gayadomonas joobiniege]|uniref:UDP-forming cellulose synthase catalytic subunit n=1 Tax=Gayadomonas joobiniege TaxID=1234606 RepID=UPI0003633249|nr:UDP-forming cellulose synthase catalytic subunit [Gayadomonas joobiniege]